MKDDAPENKQLTAAGFISPADDFLENRLDLNDLLIDHPAATFFVRAGGEAMTGAGIYPHDILIVDRSLAAANRSIVMAIVNGELIVRRLCLKEGKARLEAETLGYAPVEIGDSNDLDIWGVVTNVIHQLVRS